MESQFIEKQKFSKLWQLLFIILFIGLAFYDSDFKISNPFKLGTIILFSTFFFVSALFLIIRLETKIDKEGIYVQFFPLHFSYKYYSWKEIKSAKVRKYDAITEYGGWGYRVGWFQFAEKAYNISGDKGLQLEFINGKKLLIGTQKPEEIASYLQQLEK